MHNEGTTTIVDLSCLNEYTDGDPEANAELVEAFYETADQSIKQLQSSIFEETTETLGNWSAAAHKLKGACGYLGAESLKALCDTAQQMQAAPSSEKETTFNKIKNQYDMVRKELKVLNL